MAGREHQVLEFVPLIDEEMVYRQFPKTNVFIFFIFNRIVNPFEPYFKVVFPDLQAFLHTLGDISAQVFDGLQVPFQVIQFRSKYFLLYLQ